MPYFHQTGAKGKPKTLRPKTAALLLNTMAATAFTTECDILVLNIAVKNTIIIFEAAAEYQR
jgi:hypothetical protein